MTPPVTLPDGELDYIPGFIPAAEADRLWAELLDRIDWQEKTITLFGRPVRSPRLSAWYGDAGARYRYSGLTLEPLPWLEPLNALRVQIETNLGQAFNSVLANLYRDGNDSMGWHSDNEPELGPQPLIASLSFGAERRFLLRHRRKSVAPVSMNLEHGSLLVMQGDTQHYWRHSIPKTRLPVGARINLTFRTIQV